MLNQSLHSWLVYLVYLGGVLQALIASSNFFAPRKLGYGASLARVTPIFGHIFIAQSVYLVLLIFAQRGYASCSPMNCWAVPYWGVA